MADKLKPNTPTAFNADALRSSVGQINKQKEKASEASGMAGKLTAEACENYGFNKKALGWVAGLAKKEADQQREVITAFLIYGHAMGMFDQVDMFDGSVAVMEQIVADAKAGKSGKKPSANVTALMTGQAVN